MNEKINRLAKGIMETETPKAELSPVSFSESVNFAESGRREFSLRSTNGVGLKGLVYSDNPRVRIENAVFTGGRNRVFFQVDTSFLKPGTVIFGTICLVTNAGEFRLPYRFTAEGQSVYETPQEEEASGLTIPADQNPHYQRQPGPAPLTAFEQMLSAHFPEDTELFSELVSLLIREQQTGRFAFCVYQEAVRRDLRLTRLFEYYIYSFPEEFDGQIPREVLLYFSYDNTLDRRLKAVIYKNILQYLEPDSELYRHYEPEMRDYALQSVFQQKIDGCLAVIYAHMLYPDMIDQRVARLLPSLLKAQRIACMDSRMRRVVLRYPELSGEETYPLSDGIAYVPVFFANAQILFMDNYGRYYEGVRFTQQPVMDKPELLARCFSLDPAQKMVMLSAAREILSHGVRSEEEKAVLLDVMQKLPLRRAFAGKLAEALIGFGGSLDFLSGIDTDRLPGAQKQKIFSGLVENGQYWNAFAAVRRYGLLIAEPEALSKMADGILSEKLLPKEDEGAERFFLSVCRRVFDAGTCSRTVLTYLARAYEGATEDMYAIFCAAEAEELETTALLERILIMKLFAGTRTHLDEAFARYAAKEPREVLVRAYLSVRADDYFVREEDVPQTFFDALLYCIETAGDRSRLPSLYLLAWTKHAAVCGLRLMEHAAEEQNGKRQGRAEAVRGNGKKAQGAETGSRASGDEALLRELLEILLSDGLIFSYTKQLLEQLGIASEITEKSYVEYHGEREQRPQLVVKIEPEDTAFHEEEMRRVYQGIYLWDVQLFTDDTLHYMIYDGGGEPVQQGMISGRKKRERRDVQPLHRGTGVPQNGMDSAETAPGGKEELQDGRNDAAMELQSATRYALLDRMTAALLAGDERRLQEEMKNYVLWDALADALFDVQD